jgi:hypothetical protein
MPVSDLFLQEIRIATDYDEILALQHEGYSLLCYQITPQGVEQDSEYLWRFHVMGRYASFASQGSQQVGIEDIQWIKCLKSLGTLPTLPFYKIMHEYDLSVPDDDYCVYLAYRLGTNPRYQQLLMLSASQEDESLLQKYVKQQAGTFLPAPVGVDKATEDVVCGLMMTTQGTAGAAAAAGSSRQSAVAFSGRVLEQDGDEDRQLEDQDEVSVVPAWPHMYSRPVVADML